MGKGVKVRNTSVNGGMTGRDQSIDKVFAYKDGNSYSTMKVYAPATNPNSIAQQQVRDTFALTSTGWSNLTEAQRDLWNTEAPNWSGSNMFGSTKLSGKNLYTGVNVALVSAGKNLISVPGNKSLISKIVSANVTLIAGVFNLKLTAETTATNEVFQIHVSPQQSAGTSSCTKFVILTNQIIGTGNTDYNISALYIAKYGVINPNQKIFYKVTTVSNGGNVVEFSQGVVLS
ncbi:hypothetical protein [Flavobacterium psychrophilum]|uniref:hypothetical protein n=1 Tax=Flavobacterium psychrophilum TaxID=96345 RepID=UPI001C8F7465|nr:hypothetical protein [Flavobacterium psychrophilum]QZK98175.1 hypothetical protein K5L05_00365 [Flavobacterium psychrophilum]